MRLKSMTVALSLAMVILFGLYLVISPAITSPIQAEQVKFDPKLFHLDNPALVITHIKFPEPYERNITDVDPATVLLEGLIPPVSYSTTRAPPEFIAAFEGSTVAALIWSKIYHMGVTTPNPWVPTKLELQISGEFFDGTDWSGTGDIKVLIPTP
jgi:hypothetical protein